MMVMVIVSKEKRAGLISPAICTVRMLYLYTGSDSW